MPTIDLFRGETVLAERRQCTRFVGQGTRGILYFTNYRLAYFDYSTQAYNVELPLACLARSVRNGSNLHFHSKDSHEIVFGFDTSESWVQGFEDAVARIAFPKDQTKLFAFSHTLARQPSSSFDGWKLFHAEAEYERCLSLSRCAALRITSVNRSFAVCSSYPDVFVVPATISDDDIKSISHYRSKRRIPAVVWKHPSTQATLSRCAQPLVGLRSKRSEDDERIVQALRTCNPTNNQVLHIIDARPVMAAFGNTVMGKELCSEAEPDPASWLSRVESTQWLHYVRLIVESSDRIAGFLAHDGASVLTHCSDGWDRTSQLSATSLLLLDPFYRTLQGFAILIEKEWLSFGHMFSTRQGHGDSKYDNDQRAPIFAQWLDAVWQLTRQFPLSFEFNEQLLLLLVTQSTACRFGTFLFNCMRERVHAKVAARTESLWTYALQPANRHTFVNPLYTAHNGRLRPNASAKYIVLWERLYLRWDPDRPADVDDAAARAQSLHIRCQDLGQQLSRRTQQLDASKQRQLALNLAVLALRKKLKAMLQVRGKTGPEADSKEGEGKGGRRGREEVTNATRDRTDMREWDFADDAVSPR